MTNPAKPQHLHVSSHGGVVFSLPEYVIYVYERYLLTYTFCVEGEDFFTAVRNFETRSMRFEYHLLLKEERTQPSFTYTYLGKYPLSVGTVVDLQNEVENDHIESLPQVKSWNSVWIQVYYYSLSTRSYLVRVGDAINKHRSNRHIILVVKYKFRMGSRTDTGYGSKSMMTGSGNVPYCNARNCLFHSCSSTPDRERQRGGRTKSRFPLGPNTHPSSAIQYP